MPARGVDHANLVINQVHIVDVRVEVFQRFSQGVIECINRAVAFADDVLDFVTYFQLDCRLGDKLAAVGFSTVVLVFDQLESRLVCPHNFSDEQVEAGVGGLKLIALIFKLLHAFEDFFCQFFIFGDFRFFQLGEDV